MAIPPPEIQAYPQTCPAYLNHAASGLMDASVLHAIQHHLQTECEVGGYVAAELATPKISQARQAVAGLLGTKAECIALTDSGTRAWHRALNSIDFKPGDVVLVSPMIWGGNYFSLLQLQKRAGIVIQQMPALPCGQIDLERLPASLNPQVKLVELCWAGSGWDWHASVHEVAKMIKAAGVPLLVDACQAVGQININVDALPCDLLVASGRKWIRGPRGTGLLYVSNTFAEQNSPLGLDQHAGALCGSTLSLKEGARKFELSEASVALQLGLGRAAELTTEGMRQGRFKQLEDLASYCRSRLASLKNVVLPQGEGHTGAIVTFRHATKDVASIKEYLRSHGIEVNVHPSAFMPLHRPTQAQGDSIRISAHWVNNMAQIDHLADVLLAFDK